MQSSNVGRPCTGMGPISIKKDDGSMLRLLDALSSILVRTHEIAAAVAKPFSGYTFEIFASVSDVDENSEGICDFTVTMNPRETEINNNRDSLMNFTSLPIIGKYENEVAAELLAAANDLEGNNDLEGHVPVLKAYLANLW